MPVTVTGSQNQPYRHTIETGTHIFYADVDPEKGGQDTAPDPHALLLGALGACTSMTMQMVAQRKGWDLQEVTVTLDETQGQMRTPHIQKSIQVKGNLTADQLEKLKMVAERCPINQLIMNGAQMSSSFSHIT